MHGRSSLNNTSKELNEVTSVTYPWILEGHKIFRVVLVAQLVISIVIGMITGELLAAFIFGIPIVAVPLFLSINNPGAPISRYAVAIGTELMGALHIHQAYGLIELHFEVFVLLAFVAYFRDWKTVAISTATVAIHHIGFFALQASGAPVFAFEEGHLTFSLLLLHAAFALTEGTVLMFMAHSSHKEGVSAATITQAMDKILANPEKINFNVDIDDSNPMVKPFANFIGTVKKLVFDSSRLTNDVATSSDVIRQATSQLSETSHQSTNETATISAAVEEIAVTMELSSERTQSTNEVTETVRQSTETTLAAIETAKSTIASLRDQLNNAAKTNQELNERCANISDAMRSITMVAEQTNLLALNAAIESARAGEHGRGFAVVADEVRTLAIRSKESADEISSITEQLVSSTASSVEQMTNCVELVDNAVTESDNAASTMQTITEQINQVSENMAEVTSSVQEQGTASSSIAESLSKLHEFAQQEAQTAVELESQVESLAKLCMDMHMTMQRFEV